jgi:rare lipoprotein A
MYPPGYPLGYIERGVASWYGPGFHGNKTANGERYDMNQLTAAHRTLPLGSIALVRSLTSGREVTVRINDRGPFAKGRVLDLSYAGARAIGMVGSGTDEVELRVIDFRGSAGQLGYLRIQVGSFADASLAQALLGRVRALHYEGRILIVSLPEGKRYRVQVGQYQSEQEAKTAATRVGAELQLDPLVIRDENL